MKKNAWKEGHIPWNKGKKGYKTKPASEERKQKIRMALEGHRTGPRPQKIKERISRTLKKRFQTDPEYRTVLLANQDRAAHCLHRLEVLHSAEFGEKNAVAGRRRAKKTGGNPKQIKAMRLANFGNKYSLGRKQSENEKKKRVKTLRLTGYYQRLSEELTNRTGKQALHYINGLGNEPYPIEFNGKLKEKIRERDNYQCQKCGKLEISEPRKLTVHHIDYDKNNCLQGNLITLCNKCNVSVGSNRVHWRKFFQRKLKNKERKIRRELQLCFHR